MPAQEGAAVAVCDLVRDLAAEGAPRRVLVAVERLHRRHEALVREARAAAERMMADRAAVHARVDEYLRHYAATTLGVARYGWEPWARPALERIGATAADLVTLADEVKARRKDG